MHCRVINCQLSAKWPVTRDFALTPGRPPPRVTWFRDGRLLDDTDSGDQGSGQVTNVLRLPPLSRDDLHSSLVCSANNNNISSPATSDVIIDINCEWWHAPAAGLVICNLSLGSLVELSLSVYIILFSLSMLLFFFNNNYLYHGYIWNFLHISFQ